MVFTMRACVPGDATEVHQILLEVAQWLEETGRPLWRSIDISETQIAGDIGRYFLASLDDRPAGTLRLQFEDPLSWPDLPDPSAVCLHRVAVRRQFAGQGLAHRMLAWVSQHARALGKTRLRLDCEASRPKLRMIYEEFGFIYHSDRHVGPYLVARYELAI
jgi:GNAT superfamily N-acetyltransferase